MAREAGPDAWVRAIGRKICALPVQNIQILRAFRFSSLSINALPIQH